MTDVADAQTLNWLVQGGSFALIVAGATWLMKVLIPRTIEAFESQAAKFDTALTRQQDRNDTEHARRDVEMRELTGAVQSIATAMASIVQAIADLHDRLDRLDRHDRPTDPPSGRYKLKGQGGGGP